MFGIDLKLLQQMLLFLSALQPWTKCIKLFLLPLVVRKKPNFLLQHMTAHFRFFPRGSIFNNFASLKLCLGKIFFRNHHNKEMRMADGIILLKEMDVNEFLSHAA